METDALTIVLTSAVVAAAVAGGFTLAGTIYSGRQSRASWAREQKYSVYGEFIALMNQIRLLNPEVEFDRIFQLQARVELLIETTSRLNNLHTTVDHLVELYHNRPKVKDDKQFSDYQKQLSDYSAKITRLLRNDLKA